MGEYVLDHHLKGERARLALMSRLLDPMHRRYIEALGVGPGARALEVGCGNGSISAWLAARVSPGGRAVAFDLDLSLVDAELCRESSHTGGLGAVGVSEGSGNLPDVRAPGEGGATAGRARLEHDAGVIKDGEALLDEALNERGQRCALGGGRDR